MAKPINQLTDKMTVGKYKGYTIAAIIEYDINYAEWMIDKMTKVKFSNEIRAAVRQQFQNSC